MAVRDLASYIQYGNVVHSVNFPNIEATPASNIHTRFIVINKDVPGMIGFISNIFGKKGVNIARYLNQSNGKIGYNIIDLETAVAPEILQEIKANSDVIRTRQIRLA